MELDVIPENKRTCRKSSLESQDPSSLGDARMQDFQDTEKKGQS